jgi:hypothetical protein
MTSRARGGDQQELAAVLMPFATTHGLAFVKYRDESNTVSDSKLIILGTDGVEGHVEILEKLHELMPNLSFTKKAVESALQIVFEKHKDLPQWNIKKCEFDDWKQNFDATHSQSMPLRRAGETKKT